MWNGTQHKKTNLRSSKATHHGYEKHFFWSTCLRLENWTMRCMNFQFFSGQVFLCSKAILHRRSGWSSDIVLGIDPAVRLRSVSMRSILVLERNELHCLFHTLHSWFSRNECAKYPITAWCDLEFVHVTIERSLLLDSATKLFRTKPYFESQKKKDLHLNHQTNKIIPVSKTIDQTFKIISIFSLRGTIVFMPFIGWRYQFYQWDENNAVFLFFHVQRKHHFLTVFYWKIRNEWSSFYSLIPRSAVNTSLCF